MVWDSLGSHLSYVQCSVPYILIKFKLEPYPGEENEGGWERKEDVERH